MWRHAPRRGAARPGRGWAPAKAPVVAWRMTSDQAPVFWPFISAPALPPTGAQMGIDQLSGGSFYLDPFGWVLADQVPVTNPNIFQFAKPGLGKSGTTKAFCNRMMPFGYRTLVLGDPKDEYEASCRAHGVEPFVIGPGMSTRINPLAKGPLAHGWSRLSARGGAATSLDHLRPMAHPGPRPGGQHEDRPGARAVRTQRGRRRAQRLGDPHRLRRRQQRPAPRPPSPSCGTCCTTPPPT